jgi:hypothetical protein
MDGPRFIVSTTDIAEILCLSPRRIQQLANEEKLPRIKDNSTGQVIEGRWSIPDCVNAYVRMKVASAKDGNEDALDKETKQEKLRRIKADADLREDLRDRERAKLFHQEDVMEVLSDCMAGIKGKILALPARLTLTLVGQEDAAVINELLTTAVVELLNTIREYTPEDFRSPDLPELIAQNDDQDMEVASEEGQ